MITARPMTMPDSSSTTRRTFYPFLKNTSVVRVWVA
jgi:hypothetical protein